MSNDIEPFDPFGLDDDENAEAVTESIGDSSFPDAFASFNTQNLSSHSQRRSEPPPHQHEQAEREVPIMAEPVAPVDPPIHPSRRVAPPVPLNKSSTASTRLPPKITVKLTIHEEATSTAVPGNTGASRVSVEGRIQAQIQCSDARQNCPFRLVAADPLEIFNLNPLFVGKDHGSTATTPSSATADLIHIPKHEIGKLHLADYAFLNRHIRHMPLLLERKVTCNPTTRQCRVAVQIRTKLTNRGDLKNVTIVVAVPELVDGPSIVICRGDGVHDELKRTLHWKVPELPKGESVLVAAQMSVWETTTKNSDLQFPVLMRCESEADPISGVEFQVMPAEGHPSSVTCSTASSFRLLHRLS